MINSINTIPNTIDFSVMRVPKKEIFIFKSLGDLSESKISILVYNSHHRIVAEFNNGEQIEVANNMVIWNISRSDVAGHKRGIYSYVLIIDNEIVLSGLINFDLSMNSGGIQSIIENLFEDEYFRAVTENSDATKLTINEDLDVTGNTIFYSDVTFSGFVMLPKFSNEQEATAFAGNSLSEAMMYYDTTDKKPKTYDGSSWV